MSDGGWGDGSASISVWSVGWPLLNTVIFGVLLNENFFQSDEKAGGFSGKDLQREFAVTYFCTLVLEMLYYPKLSLPWFLLCGLLMWVSVRELCGWTSLDYVEIGSATDASESLYAMVMNPIRHILSERKSRKIAVFLLINTGYMVVEFVAGFMSNSLGLISDACHMLFDCAALAIGLYASYISRLPADNQYNYGRGRTEVLSGYVNAVLLVLVGVLIVLESFERILDPQEISTNSLLIVSVGGLLVNVVGLIFFHEEHHHAHGGGGTCSHSHSHSHSHSDHHHDKHDNITVHDHGPNADHLKCVEVSHEISNDHSHAGHDQHHSCSDHNNHHPHDSSKEKEDSHDHHCHGHGHDHRCHEKEHDHHCHEKEHDHHDHSPKAEVYIHHNSVEPMHNLQRLDASSENSLGHSHESREHNHCHGDKKNCSNKETVNPNGTQDHSHVHSCHLKKSSPRKDSERHHHIDHNMEGIFLHVLADTMGSVGVVISTLLIKYRGWLVADPACSIFISVMIVASVIPLLRNSAEILLQRIPRAHEQDLNIAADALMRIKGVCGVQKLHVWNFTNTDIVGSVHLHVSAETDKASVKIRASDVLHEAGIKDVTIQVECVKG